MEYILTTSADMVTKDENSVICIVLNKLPKAKLNKISLMVRPSYTVAELFKDIRRQLDITDNFELILDRSGEFQVSNYHFTLIIYKKKSEVTGLFLPDTHITFNAQFFLLLQCIFSFY